MSKSDMIYALYIWPLAVIGTIAVIGLVYELLSWLIQSDWGDDE